MTDKNPDDIDLQQIMEMIDDKNVDEESSSSHQQSPEEIAENEPKRFVDEPAKDNADAKLVYETLNSNLALKQEVDRLRVEKEEAERIALHGVLRSFETQIDSAYNDNGRLKQELIRARDDGDTAASVDIESRIRDNQDQIRDLKGKVDQYSPILNQSRRQPEAQIQQAVQPDGNKMAGEWLRENETWLTDPKHTDKRDYANNLFKEMQSNKMDMNSLTFWTKFEKSLSDFDHKKSPSSQQQRMPKNMVTYNSNGSNSSNSSRPTSYKQNPEFVQKVAFLAKNVIKNEDLLKDEKMLNSMLKHYHKVYKAGNFRHLPQSMD